MKSALHFRKSGQRASALVLSLLMSSIALAILAGAMTWAMNSNKLTQRSIEYNRAVLAAEADTEKITSQMARDFLMGGQKLVNDNMPVYQAMVPTSSDSSYWSNWEFNDALGNTGRTFVQSGVTNYGVIDGLYAGLHGFMCTVTVVSHARETGGYMDVTAGVLQELQLVRVPIFQNSLYSSGNMEISCGQPFFVTGRVHSNKTLYVEPDNVLTFGSSVTAVTDILFQRDPNDSRGAPAGSAVYVHPDEKESPVPALNLPIGLTNTPEAIREIIEPPGGEDPDSPLGRLKYYNQCDLILTLSDTGLSATSGKFNDFSTTIPTNELDQFVITTNQFWDAREGKTVASIDIDIGALKTWSETNSDLRPALATNILGTNSLSSIYIWDKRNLPGTKLGAVRVFDGTKLPAAGLTVATGRPLYVFGDYNQSNSGNLGTTNTQTTKPASLVGDAITVLSDNWKDKNSTADVGSRNAGNTTVNAAFLTGAVETANGNYSGGMENFPRFLETWGSIVFTYNGSMVKMFPSLYATNIWGKANVYAPPKRNWAYDMNFEHAELIPPLTPCMVVVARGKWATVGPGKNVVTAGP
jgi:hypothetical protein